MAKSRSDLVILMRDATPTELPRVVQMQMANHDHDIVSYVTRGGLFQELGQNPRSETSPVPGPSVSRRLVRSSLRFGCCKRRRYLEQQSSNSFYLDVGFLVSFFACIPFSKYWPPQRCIFRS